MHRAGWISLGLVLGLLMGRIFFTEKTVSDRSSQDWAQQGAKEISRETDPAKQLALAEEYYGKAVVLFLAALVHRTSAPAPSVASATLVEDVAEPVNESGGVSSSPGEASREKPSRELTAKERKAQEVAQRQQSDLDRLITFKKTAAATKMVPQIRKMQGYFVGQLVHKNARHSNRIDPMTVLIDLAEESGKLKGKALIVISDPEGKEYSRANNTGENQSLRLVPGRKDLIYLVPAPGEFILLNISNENRLQGEYYDENGAYWGRVVLNRS